MDVGGGGARQAVRGARAGGVARPGGAPHLGAAAQERGGGHDQPGERGGVPGAAGGKPGPGDGARGAHLGSGLGWWCCSLGVGDGVKIILRSYIIRILNTDRKNKITFSDISIGFLYHLLNSTI